ncbi:MAG: hypothetical protein Q9201_006143 [Fulgogasparrea decipioides]
MCYHEIEKYGCGHEDKHLIPCEALCDKGKCDKPEEDQVRDNVGPTCGKCKAKADEDDWLQEELSKFTVQESLQPSAPVRTRDPNAPKLYFKRFAVAVSIFKDLETKKILADGFLPADHSHPRPSDIERDESDPEYIPVEGRGNCFDCSAAPQSEIDKMKRNGDYEKEDPWGAMSRVEVGTGSSRDAALPSLEEIGQGLTHAEAIQQTQNFAPESPPSSPERGGAAGKLDKHPNYESEDESDTVPGKGKGRLGEAVREHPSAATVDSDASDDEHAAHPTSKKAARRPDSDEDEEEDESEEEEEEEEEDEGDRTAHRGRQPRRAHGDSDEEDEGHAKIPNWSATQPSDKRAHRKGSEDEHDEDDDASEEEDESDGHSDVDGEDREHKEKEAGDVEFASPEDLKAAGFPPNTKMPKRQLQAILARKKREGDVAMTQHNRGEVE